jgi:hypothetical protein
MTYRDDEKARLVPLKEQLFSAAACTPGRYAGTERDYPYCLDKEHSAENLHVSIRSEAIRSFADRDIDWHDGIRERGSPMQPSNHLCCSQSFCVNTWFPFVRAPAQLKQVLMDLGFDVEEVLPFDADEASGGGAVGYLAFEWIGQRNYLRERKSGAIAPDWGRNRGKGFTSADVAIRFRRKDGKIQIVLLEWKYTERYGTRSLRYSGSGTDRLDDIYRPELTHGGCPVRLPAGVDRSALFFDPFDQMMRLQLLAAAMERSREMGADVVSFAHATPAENHELNGNITSAALQAAGMTGSIHEVWRSLVPGDRFAALHTEDVVAAAVRHASEPTWATWMETRYGASDIGASLALR